MPLTNEPQPPSDFRLFLQEEFVRRCRKNPGYSIRAFARSLDTDFSTLAKILKGLRPLGPTSIRRLSSRLGLSPAQVQTFLQKNSRGRPADSGAESATQVTTGAGAVAAPDYQQLTLDSFQIISDWYHYAILELMRVEGFRPDFRWIAKTLSITASEARIAVERLERVGIIEITEGGEWLDRSEGYSTTTGNSFTAAAFRNLQRQILEKAITAMEEIPMEQRDQSSMTMAIDSKLLPKAREKIKSFRRELEQLLSAGKKTDEVVHLSVSLYPVTTLKKKAKKEKRK